MAEEFKTQALSQSFHPHSSLQSKGSSFQEHAPKKSQKQQSNAHSSFQFNDKTNFLDLGGYGGGGDKWVP